jgi:hypothetical protein
MGTTNSLLCFRNDIRIHFEAIYPGNLYDVSEQINQVFRISVFQGISGLECFSFWYQL